MHDTTNVALLAHIAAQTRSNIDLLVSQNYLQASDAAVVLTQLASIESSNTIMPVADRTQHLSLNDNDFSSPRACSPSPPKAVMPARRNVAPPLPPPSRTQAKALWDYNERGTDPDDLSFRAGDIIEIVSETNADWWTGKCNGRQGLFPANYVEKLPPRAPPSPDRAPIPVPAPTGSPSSAHYSHSYSPAPAYGGPPPLMWQPPPAPYGGYGAPVPPPVITAPAPPQEPKKSKFSGLGNTMATAAAGGLGFGAGSAIGADVVHAIF